MRQFVLRLTIFLALWDKIEILVTKVLAQKTKLWISPQKFRHCETKLWFPPYSFFKIFGTLEKLYISEWWVFAKLILDVVVILYSVVLMTIENFCKKQ